MQNLSIMAHLDATDTFRIQRLEVESQTIAVWVGEITVFFKSTAQVEQLRDTLAAFLESETPAAVPAGPEGGTYTVSPGVVANREPNQEVEPRNQIAVEFGI